MFMHWRLLQCKVSHSQNPFNFMISLVKSDTENANKVVTNDI